MTRKITFVDDKQSDLIWIPIPISRYASCTSDSQCPANERCWSGECRIQPEKRFCVDGARQRDREEIDRGAHSIGPIRSVGINAS